MKKYVLFTLASAMIFCACAKGEPPAAEVSSPAAPPAAPQQAQGCLLLAENLPPCAAFTCGNTIDMFGIAVNNIFTIKGVEDKRCIFTQEIEAEGEREEVMICALDRQSSAQLAEYYGKYFAAGGNIEASGTVDLASGVSTVTETINGEQVVNPLNGLFSKGVCVAAGMAPADTPAIQLAPGVSLEITNPDGAVTKYTTDEQGNTVMLTQ